MKKLVKMLLVAVLTMVMGTGMVVWARATSSYYGSPAAETGYWWSGNEEDEIVVMTATSSNVSGSSAGLEFDMPSVGIPSGLIPSIYRNVTVELKESDGSVESVNTTVRRYNGNFEYSPEGVYTISDFGLIETYSGYIETDKVVELYIRMYVEPVTGDAYSCLPKNLFQYRYWVN